VVRTPERKTNKRKEFLPPMVKSQEDGITILLELKDYKVEQVREHEDRIVVKVMLERREKKCPYCDLTRFVPAR